MAAAGQGRGVTVIDYTGIGVSDIARSAAFYDFEAWPAAGQQKRYLDLAAALRPELDGVDGFVSIERFQSLTEPGKVLSLSFWRDEAAVETWRNLPAHRATRTKDRSSVFSDYRLRVASVFRD